MLNGWLIIDKPVGPTSTHVVGAVKRALREGGYPKVKVGHGGTLDPLASGVLPVALGEATKLSGRMLDADKVYAFTIAFGTGTDTLDAEGASVEIGGNDRYISLCRRHFMDKLAEGRGEQLRLALTRAAATTVEAAE